MNNELKLPPYGRIMQAYIDANIFPVEHEHYPCWNIYVGRDADKFAKRQLTEGREVSCYLPYNQSYEQYKWPITGQNVCIINVGLFSINLLKKMSVDLFEAYKPKTLIAYESIHSVSDKEYVPANTCIILFSK